VSRAPRLGFLPPQLPSLTDQPPEGSDWIHEVKHDGTPIDSRAAPTKGRNEWTKFWQQQSAVSDKLLGQLLEVFVERIKPVLQWHAGDVVLDIGCGPGELARLIKDQVREIHGVDISKSYIGRARERFARDDNVFFHELDPERYTDLSFLPTRKFSLIICHSVIQYYRGPEDLQNLIREVGRIALPGARLLIADIPSGKGRLREAAGLALAGLKGGYLREVVKTFVALMGQTYRRARSSGGLWNLEPKILLRCAQATAAEYEVIEQPLTAYHSRRHLLLRYSRGGW
jgi:SAM-dependent methyltransferase